MKMNNSRKSVCVLLSALMAAVLAGCSPIGTSTTGAAESSGASTTEEAATAASTSSGPVSNGMTVGISLPTEHESQWSEAGEDMKAQLEQLGYEVDLEYAGNRLGTQSEQIEAMAEAGEDLLIVAATDSTALNDALSEADAAGIPVIAYERMLRDTDAVDAYITFDDEETGRAQARFVLQSLGLENEDGSPAADGTGTAAASGTSEVSVAVASETASFETAESSGTGTSEALPEAAEAALPGADKVSETGKTSAASPEMASDSGSTSAAAYSGETFTVEIFSGDGEDETAEAILDGMISELQPYVDAGAVTFGSGRSTLAETCISGWSRDNAAQWMSELLNGTYDENNPPDAILCANDEIAAGVIQALTSDGRINPSDVIITGASADGTVSSNLVNGTQAMTCERSEDSARQAAVDIADAILRGGTSGDGDALEGYGETGFYYTYDPTSYENGAKAVPAYIIWPSVLTTQEVQSDPSLYSITDYSGESASEQDTAGAASEADGPDNGPDDTGPDDAEGEPQGD